MIVIFVARAEMELHFDPQSHLKKLQFKILCKQVSGHILSPVVFDLSHRISGIRVLGFPNLNQLCLYKSSFGLSIEMLLIICHRELTNHHCALNILILLFRPYWRCYFPNTQAIIYVVDSSDTDRLVIAKEEFHAILEVLDAFVFLQQMMYLYLMRYCYIEIIKLKLVDYYSWIQEFSFYFYFDKRNLTLWEPSSGVLAITLDISFYIDASFS